MYARKQSLESNQESWDIVLLSYLGVFFEGQEVLLDEDLGLDERHHRLRLVAVVVAQADVQVKAQGWLAADPWIHLF